jgi:hypothetical protein
MVRGVIRKHTTPKSLTLTMTLVAEWQHFPDHGAFVQQCEEPAPGAVIVRDYSPAAADA